MSENVPECYYVYEYDNALFTVRACAREDALEAKFIRAENSVSIEVPWGSDDELRRKFKEAVKALLSVKQ